MKREKKNYKFLFILVVKMNQQKNLGFFFSSFLNQKTNYKIIDWIVASINF